MPLKIFPLEGHAEVADLCAAIYDAADAGVDVINMSLGSNYPSAAEREAVNYAVSKGCIVAASAGNDGAHYYSYPASYDGVVSCASIDKWKAHSYFSNDNDCVDVAAPGEEVLTTAGKKGYDYVSGTSFSAPYVSAIAVLAKAVDDQIDSYRFHKILSIHPGMREPRATTINTATALPTRAM